MSTEGKVDQSLNSSCQDTDDRPSLVKPPSLGRQV